MVSLSNHSMLEIDCCESFGKLSMKITVSLRSLVIPAKAEIHCAQMPVAGNFPDPNPPLCEMEINLCPWRPMSFLG